MSGTSPTLRHRNRARINVANIQDLQALGPLSSTWQTVLDAIQALGSFLPVSPNFQLWTREETGAEYENLVAFGIEGGLSSRRIRNIIRFGGFSRDVQRTVTRLLPALSAGGYVAVGDRDTVFRIEAQIAILPRGLQNVFDRFANSLTNGGQRNNLNLGGVNPVRIIPGQIEVSNTESWAGGFFSPEGGQGTSPIDNVTEYKVSIGIDVAGGNVVQGSLVYRVSRRTYQTNIGGESRTVTVEQIFQRIVGVESGVLQALGLPANIDTTGYLESISAWDFSSRRRLDVEVLGPPGSTATEIVVRDGPPILASDTNSSRPFWERDIGRPFDGDSLDLGNGRSITQRNGIQVFRTESEGEIVVIARSVATPWTSTISSRDSATGETTVTLVVGSGDDTDAIALTATTDSFGNRNLDGVDPNSPAGRLLDAALNESQARLDGKELNGTISVNREDNQLIINLQEAAGVQATARLNLPRGLSARYIDGRQGIFDSRDRSVTIEYERNSNGDFVDKDGNVTDDLAKAIILRTRHSDDGVDLILERDPNNRNRVLKTTVKVAGNPIGVDFQDAGKILGGILGNRIGDSAVERIVASAALSTVLGNVGEVLNIGVFGGGSTKATVGEALQGIGFEFAESLQSSALGALSTFLTAELVNALGVRGFAGEVLNAGAGAVIGQVINNIASGSSLFAGVNPIMIGQAVGAFLGTKLASKVITFNSVGGQIGAALGSSLFVSAGTYLSITQLGFIPGLLPVAALAFVGFIIGGLIGSIFGGTPRSGADVVWDERSESFKVDNVYSRKGGSKDVARSMAGTVSEVLNFVLQASEGKVDNPTAITVGNYGMRGGDLVYRPTSSQDKNDITFRVSAKSKNATDRLVGYGLFEAIKDQDFEIVGGSDYVKRAIYGSVEANGTSANNFDRNALIGNISTALAYQDYLRNDSIAGALSFAESDSAFAGELAVTLVRAVELGLHRRHRSDWFGGFGALIQEANTSALSLTFDFEYDPFKDRISRITTVGDYVLGDSIDTGAQTAIDASDVVDNIDLRSGRLADQTGYTVNGHLNNDIAASSTDFTGKTGELVSFTTTALRATATVALVNNTAAEAAEKFLGQLSNGTGVSIIGGAAEATIIDGTSAKPTLLVGRSYALEGDGHAVFRLSLSKALSGGQTLSVALATAAVNATAGADYLAGVEISTNGLTGWTAATSATFAAGQTQLFARVAITPDNGTDAQGKPTNVEGNERFSLTATVAAGTEAAKIANVPDVTSGAVAVSGIGTIVDASVGATPLAWIDSVTVDETAGTVAFSIARSRAGAAGSVSFSTADRRELVIDVAATVDAGDGNDTVHASNLGDNIFGGAGNDTLYGGRLDDWLLGGDGDDVLNAGSATLGTLGGDGNYLNGGAGSDLLIGREGSDWLEGGDGTDRLEGGDGGDILAGGGGAGDILRGGRGDDQYIFRIGDAADMVRDESGQTVQQIVSQAYDDVFTGAALSDRIAEGLSGALFRSGRGLNNWGGGGSQLSVEGVAAGGEDALVMGVGVSIEDIKISKSPDGKDLIIELWPDGVFAGDRVTLQDWFTSFNKIETLRFADGNEIRLTDFDTFILGSDGSETIIGTAGNDFVHAGAGDDLVYLLSGNDFGNGGLGNDSVSGDSGNDIVVGGDGDDTLIGGQGVDVVSGGRGNDRLTGDDGNDIVAGGSGDDEAIGGSGDDVFKFQRGDGRDTLIDALTNEWVTVWISGSGGQNGYVVNPNGTITHATLGTLFDGQVWSARTRYSIETGRLDVHRPANAAVTVANSGADMIEFGIGIDINDIQFRSVGNDLEIGIEQSDAFTASFNSIDDRIVLKEWLTTAKGSIEKFVFFNTGAVDTSAAAGGLDLKGGDDGDNVLTGTAGRRNWITGGAGDDTITGAELDDILNGNSGQDTLNGGAGADALLGGLGNDTLNGGAGADTLIGGQGLDIAAYDTQVSVSLGSPAGNTGEAAGDSFDSIEGLRGSAFADTLEGDFGENDLRGALGDDTLRGAGGDDLYTFARGDGTDTVLDIGSGGENEIVDANGNLQPPYVASVELVDRDIGFYQFAHIVTNRDTGEIVYRKEVQNAVGVGGFLSETSGIDYAPPAGFAADGWVRNADNSVRFTVSGNRVFESISAPGGSDTILFEDATPVGAAPTADQTIALSDLSFAFTGNDLHISLGTLVNGTAVAGGKVIVKEFRTGATANANSLVEGIQFSDGSSVNLAGLKFDSNGVLLSASTDSVSAPVDDFLVRTTAGTASGGFGNDTLLGSTGNDTLQGGDGDDVLFGGMGSDSLQGGAGIDTISYAGSDGTTANRAIGVTVTLGVGAASGTASGTGTEAATDTLSSIENVIGSQFNDTITGNEANNVLKGNRGNDTLSGGGGSGTLAGLGADVLIGDDGDDTLNGGVGEDSLDGGTGNDLIDGGGDRDVLAGGDGNDILRGDGSAGTSVGGTLVLNASFEDAGDTANDVTQAYGLTSVDLPGFSATSTNPFQLLTSAAGVTALSGARALHLDNGAANTVTQTIEALTAGEQLNLNFFHGLRTAAATGGVEVYWNGTLVRTVTGGTTALAAATQTVLTAIEGRNTLAFKALGAIDGAGSVIDNVQLTRITGAADQLIGGAGQDRLDGGAGNDVLLGGDGDDIATFTVSAGAVATTGAAGLYGGAGNDTLDGGAGNDTLDGGAGNDSYLFQAGSGADTVIVGTGATAGQDDLIFDKIAHNQLWLRRVGNDLEVTALNLGSVVLVKDWYVAQTSQARRIVTQDRTLARSNVQALVDAMAVISPTGVPGTWPPNPSAAFTDALTAAWQDNASYSDRAIMTGTTGNDTLNVDPILIGGVTFVPLAGTDTITGSASDDTIVFGVDAGFKTINAGAGTDSIVASVANATINLSTASTGYERISANGNTGVVLNLTGTTAFDLTNITVEGITRIAGTTGADTITGSTGDDTIRGGLGSDVIDGGAGADTYDASDLTSITLSTISIANPAAGSHVVTGTNAATDTLRNFENVIGAAVADTITGSAAANRLDGRAGNDTISGGDGDDILIGGTGGDGLIGGTGADTASYETWIATPFASPTVDVPSTISITGVRASLATHSSTNGTAAGAAVKATQGDAAGDWFFQVENLTGSVFNDRLEGDAAANVLKGGGGADALYGGAGDDSLQGDAGNDYLDGGNSGIGVTNIAVYEGTFDQYLINTSTASQVTVTGQGARAGDGVDTLKSIQQIRFADVTVTLGVNVNNAPILGQPAMADQSGLDGTPFSYVIPASSFIDLDINAYGTAGIDAMVLSATLADNSPLPSWLSFNPTTRTFSGTIPAATEANAGEVGKTYEIRVTASDSGGSVSDSFVLAIGEKAGADLVATTGPLAGTFRAERMTGTAAADVFLGSRGADRIDGLGETATSGDRVDYAASDSGVTVDLKAGTGSGGHAEGDTLIQIEQLYGSAFADVLTGGDGGVTSNKEVIKGEGGDDIIDGGLGDDALYGGDGFDTIRGGAGRDTIYARTNVNGSLEDQVDGGDGIDELILTESANAATVDLTIEGNTPASIEHVIGTNFSDLITGNEFDNILSGGLGNDSLRGGRGADQLSGNDGNDDLKGGEGNDVLRGDAGDDRLTGGAGSDNFYGGAGNDTINYWSSTTGVSVNLTTGAFTGGDAQGDLISDASIENVDGSDFADVITGSSVANVLQGFAGNDTLTGGAGNDVFDGGSGTDTIVYAGNKADYTIDRANRRIIDNNLANGNDGTDNYVNVETAQFADGTENLTNQAPVTGTALTAQSAADNGSFSYVIPATAITDPDGDVLTWSATLADGSALPAWLSFNPTTRTVSYSGGANLPVVGAYSVRVSAADGQASASQIFALTVNLGAGANIVGTAGNDTTSGTIFRPTFRPEAIDGLAGTDTLSYDQSNAGVTVSLAGGAGSGGHAQGDTVINVENLIGSAFADSLTGSGGNNDLRGGGGDDSVNGGLGNDTLFGGTGNDTLSGAAGNDVISGGVGIDTLDGGADVDTLSYLNSDNGILATVGVVVNLASGAASGGDAAGDVIVAGSFENLEGTNLADTLTGDANANTLTGHNGDDTIAGGAGNDTLIGGIGNDSLSGEAGIDTIQGGDGNDTIHALVVGEDTIDGGTGTDTVSFAAATVALTIDLTNVAHKLTNIENVIGGSGNNTITGSIGANALSGGGGNDVLAGGAGADALNGGTGIDTASYATAAAAIAVDLTTGTGSAGDAVGDTLTGIENADGSAFNDTLVGSAGANTLRGNAGVDTIQGRAGDDTLFGDAGNDLLAGEDGVDTLWGGDGDDNLDGGLGNDVLRGDAQNDTLSGRDGADQLFGDAGDDTLFGGALADTLDGGDGNDQLSGGTGGDTLTGGLGTDTATYLFSDNGVLATALVIADLATSANNTGDAASDGYSGIENLRGTNLGDTLRGDANANALWGEAGNDTLQGRAGDDALFGGDGDDQLFGEDGADTIDGGIGNDTISGGIGNDIITAGDGNDTINGDAGADTINAGAGNDSITALVVGEDTIDGGAGTDTVSFAGATAALSIDITNPAHKLANIENIVGGSGSDVISGSAIANTLDGGAGDDTIQGGAGGDTLIGGSGRDLLIYSGSAAGANFQSDAIGAVAIAGVAAVVRTLNGVDVNLALNTATGADATGDVISGFEDVGGSAFADRLRGSSGNTTVYGQAGDDVIYGGAGNDILHGDDGNDFIFGEAGADMIYGGNGDDRLFGDGDPDQLFGGAGNDILDAGDAGDMLDGGTGDDIMTGGAGDDRYYLTKTSGVDTIYNYSSSAIASPDLQDVVQYSADVIRSDLWFTKVGRDLRVKVLGQSAQVTVKDWFINTTAGDFTNAGAQYVLRMFIAGQAIATTVDSLPQLLGVMAGIVEPASFAALSGAQQTAINNAWILNTAPTIASVAGNATTLNEDGSVDLFFDVADNGQTPLASINVTANGSGAVTAGPVSVVAGNEGRRKVTITGAANANGAGSVTLNASDSIFNTPLVVNLTVAAVADGVTLSAPASAIGNSGTAISLAGIATALIDGDGSETLNALRIEAIPVGAVLASGANTFTASAGNQAVDIRGWNLATLTITPPAGSSSDFSLTVRASSRESSNGAVSGDVTRAIAVTVDGRPNAPVSTNASLTYAENQTGNTGVTFSATDPDGDAITYLFANGTTTSGAFTIQNGNQLWVSSALNFEAQASYSVSIIARTARQDSVALTQTINVGNVNEALGAVSDANGAANTIGEGVQGSAAIVGITASATDPDGTVPSYAIIAGNTLGWFQINATTGVVTTVVGANIDFEAATSVTLTIQASDGVTTPVNGGFVISIGNANEAPSAPADIDPAANTIADGAGAGTIVGVTARATDPEGVNPTYAITGGNSFGWFTINATTGVISVAAGQTVQYETAQSASLTVQASDGANTSSGVFAIGISDVNETPAITSPAASSVDENVSGVYNLIALTSSDPDLAGSANGTSGHSFSIVIDPSGAFEIVGNMLRKKAGFTFNREVQANYGLTIRVRDNANTGLFADQAVTIAVNDVNETPVVISGNSAVANENDANVVALINLGANDPDGDGLGIGEAGHVWSIVAGDTSRFEIVGATLRKKAGVVLDRESVASYGLTVRVTDGGGLIADQAVTITVGNVNETPHSMGDIDGAYGGGGAVNEGWGPGTLVGITARATDPDGDGLSYSITSGNVGGLFAVNAATGVVSIAAGQVADYETHGGSVTLTIAASDGTLSTSANYGITINDVNEQPWFTSSASFGISEGSGARYVGTIVTADSDLDGVAFGEAGHVIYLTNDDGGRFEVRWNGNTNQRELWTTAGSSFDFENPADRVRTLQARVYDNSGNSGWSDRYQDITVNISNINEAPTTPTTAIWPWAYENDATSWAITGAVDPEGAVVTYALATNPGGIFAITNPTGSAALTFAGGVAYDFEWIRANAGGLGAYVAPDHSYAYIPVQIAAHDGAIWSNPFTTYFHVYNRNDVAPNAPILTSAQVISFSDGWSIDSGVEWHFGTPSDGDGNISTLSYRVLASPYFDANAFVNYSATTIGGGDRSFDFEAWYSAYPELRLNANTLRIPIDIAAFDGANYSTATRVFIDLFNVNDNTTYLTVPGQITVTENLVPGTPVTSQGQIQATDADGFAITYSIVGGNINDAFYINPTTGVLSVAGPNGVDHESPNWLSDANGKYTILSIGANDGDLNTVRDMRVNIGNIRKYVYNNGYANPADYTFNSQYTQTGGGGWGWGSEWYNEVWLTENSTGRVLAYMGQSSQWEGTFSAPFPHAAQLAWGYVGVGSWPGPFTMYSDDEFNDSEIYGVPFGNPFLPVVFDLKGDGLNLLSAIESNIEVDFNGDGIAERTGWIAGDDAFLALDRNGDGEVRDLAEISFVDDFGGARTDLEGLQAFDTNGDQRLDAADADFGRFLLWQDTNADGIGQASELISLVNAGITYLSLVRENIAAPLGSMTLNQVLATATFGRADNTTGTVGDIALGRLPNGPVVDPAEPLFRFDTTTGRFENFTPTQTSANDDEPAQLLPTGTRLALDADGNGVVDTTTETFDLATAITTFDSDGDAAITSDDDRYFDLRLWSDANANNRAELVELTGLDTAGLTRLALNGVPPEPEAPGEPAVPGYPATPEPGDTDVTPLPELAFRGQSFDRKAGRFAIMSRGGSLFVSAGNEQAVQDARAGALPGAAMLTFANRTVGLLAPIVLDLDGDGITLRNMNKTRAQFDMDGDGTADNTGWVGKGDGLLVIDRNNDGKITTASEISFLTEDADATSDLLALAMLDANRDGALNASDARFEELKLWVDANSNGVSEDGELKSLADHNVTSISLAGRAVEQTVRPGKNIVLATTIFTRGDGSTGTVGDVALAFDPSSAKSGDERPQRMLPEAPALPVDTQMATLRNASSFSFEQGGHVIDTNAAASPAVLDSDDAQIARMVQAMASFGASSGASNLLQKQVMLNAGLDWVTASAA